MVAGGSIGATETCRRTKGPFAPIVAAAPGTPSYPAALAAALSYGVRRAAMARVAGFAPIRRLAQSARRRDPWPTSGYSFGYSLQFPREWLHARTYPNWNETVIPHMSVLPRLKLLHSTDFGNAKLRQCGCRAPAGEAARRGAVPRKLAINRGNPPRDLSPCPAM